MLADGCHAGDVADNRPYLRCLHGFGLCPRRLKRFNEAATVFTRMLWMNPTDNKVSQFRYRQDC